jgi:DNA-binding transcriptional LysR family regulator
MNALIKRAVSTPDLNDVALFVHVVQAESFSAAAKAHGVPVSTVSRRIARLETRLGTRLLERTTRRLRLTDVGRTYFAHAERALDELTQGAHHVRVVDVVPRGRIRITAPVGLGGALTTALAPFLAAHPQVAIELDLSERRADLVAEGFDIALRAGPVDSADFTGRQLVVSTRHLVASADYLARRGSPRRIADLPSHDLIATRASTGGAVWELYETGRGRKRRRRRVAFKPRLAVNEMFAARDAARAGIGIAFVPPFDDDGDGLERVLPAVSGEPTGMWLLYPARRSLTAAVRACVQHLIAVLPSTPQDLRARGTSAGRAGGKLAR